MTIIDEYLNLTTKYKKEYGDNTLVLLQVGSFFECYALIDKEQKYYGSDIQNFSDINDLVISRKNTSHKGTPVVMAGFGLPQLEKYVKRLQEHDYTIVIYTQDSNNKNTTRSLFCIYSPGTYFNNDYNHLNNVTTCIWIHYSASNQLMTEKITIGMSSIDIYTGHSNTSEYSIDFIKGPSIFDTLENYISINNPSECIIVSNTDKFDYILNLINCKHHIYNYEHEWVNNISKQKYQYEIIKVFFNTEIFTEWNISTQSYCLLIQFIFKHNPNLIKKLKPPTFENYCKKLILANHSLKQLNIISDSRHTGKQSSLSALLNNCITNMGKRAFNYNLLNPSIDPEYLKKQYDITEYCLTTDIWKTIRNTLSNIKDISKIYRKMILGKLSPKDYWIIYNTLNHVNNLYVTLSQDDKLSHFVNNENVTYRILEIQNFIMNNLNIENCKFHDDLSFDKFSITNIEKYVLFNNNYSTEICENYNTFNSHFKKFYSIKDFLDLTLKQNETLTKKNDSSEYIKVHECPKTEPTLIGTTRRLNILKKMINDITCNHFDVKSIEIKNHTGSNSMITSNEINTISKNILKYKEKYLKLLSDEFTNFSNNFICEFEQSLSVITDYIIICDTLQNKCYIAETYNYCKPDIIDCNEDYSFVEFKELRHPLIEKINQNEIYITNDLAFNTVEKPRGYLLYGTNAVGKTSFIKSIGIAIIMAQSGLFVPASNFRFSIYKCIFTRILGNDNIFKGLSTFAVEMTELRTILKDSNHNSLILGDELCSGTETTSALSIFTAGIDYLSTTKASFIFATHFHEILKYEEIKNLLNNSIVNCLHLSVIFDREANKLIYDRKLKNGPGESMYGLEVCKSLNLPDNFLEKAHNIRIKYTDELDKPIIDSSASKYNSLKLKGICEICKENQGTEIHHLIYQKNYNDSLYNKSIINHKANLINICETCHDKIHQEEKELKIYKTTNGYELM